MPFGQPYGYGNREPSYESYYPEFYRNIFSRIGQGQQAQTQQLMDLMGYNVGQLGKNLGWQMGKSNVPIAGGWDMMARRFLGPMQTQMQNWLQANQMPWHQQAMTGMNLTNLLDPLLKQWYERKGTGSSLSGLFDFMFPQSNTNLSSRTGGWR